MPKKDTEKEKYTYIEHTADAKFMAFGKTLEEAYENAVLAMSNIITDTQKIEPKKQKELILKSENLESLLYDFLEQVITLVELEGFLVSIPLVKKIKKTPKGYMLTALLKGDTYKSSYELKTEIKAITYNDMKIGKKTCGTTETYEITAVVDI